MDFLSLIRHQSEKLNGREYVNHLWEEIEGKNFDADINPTAVQDFNNHLPVLLEQFWEDALQKLTGITTLDEYDEEVKTYLLVLIYQCITQSHELISYSCVLYASEVYLSLLTTPQTDDFYKSKLYCATLNTLQSSLEATVSESVNNRLMYKLRCFLTKAKFNASDLEVTLATLIQIIFIKSQETFQTFEVLQNPGSVAYEALLSLKVLFEQENIPSRKIIITTYLFNGLRRHNTINLTPRHFNLIQVNFRNLLKSLHPKFKQDHYKTFLNAFIHIWKHPDFTFYGEAVCIMNSLKEKHYRTLIDILNKMMISKTVHKNLFKFSLAIICFSPKHVSIDKVKVTNEILLKNILLNCISNKSEISNAAVESLAEILMSPDLSKEYVEAPVKAIFNASSDQTMSTVTIIRGIQSLMNKKWSNRSKNKHLFVIFLSIMLFSEEDHPQIYREVLEYLTEGCSPFDLKPFISLLSETYLKLNEKKYIYSALQVLKVIFKMALHPMASSTEFVKHLYMAMIYPNICKGISQTPELFIDPIISDDFNFSEFFQKCHTLGLIKKEHISRNMENLSTIRKCNLKLLCVIVHLTEYKELSQIADHIHNHFMMICNSSDLNYLFYIYNKIFKNNTDLMRLNSNLRCNEIMVCFIKHHLLRQSFRWDCVANAFALLKTLEEFTNLNEDFLTLKEQYDKSLALTLRSRGSFLPLLYFSQLVIFSKVIPNDINLKAVTDFLQLCSNEIHQRSPEFNPKLWIGCLLLYTNISVIRTNLVESCMEYLQSGLNSSVMVVKLASLNMTFDLCNLVTHNFDDLIRYMFKQLVYGDIVFKKTCLKKIDRLIRDDYLKLDLEQFLVFTAILGDRDVDLSDYLKQLLNEFFFVSNAPVTARYFVPLIVHINGYRKHNSYKLSKNGYELIELVARNVSNRRKIYTLLFTSFPVKTRFNIIQIISTQILEKMMKGVIKLDEGFWKMMKDSIFIFKLIASNSNDEEFGENYYKKVLGYISKYLLQKTEYSEKSSYVEYHKEITQGTELLLKLLFFNDFVNIQQHISISLVDAIVHWTNFLMADLVHIVHIERNKTIQNHFFKFEKYYKENCDNLRYTEESFESENNNLQDDVVLPPRFLFSMADDYVPPFENS